MVGISLQKHVLSLDGPVVTASGFEDELAVVTHAAECLPSNEQVSFLTRNTLFYRKADDPGSS